MPLVPDFSTSEDIGSPSKITLTDTSTGSDGSLTSRRIAFKLSNQTYITTAGIFSTITYETWPIGNNSITLDFLPKSETIDITVDWLTGNTATYTKTILTCFDLFDYVFALNQLSTQTSMPQILSDQDYFNDFLKLIVNIFNAENAVLKGDDQFSSQGALDKNYFLMQNSSAFF